MLRARVTLTLFQWSCGCVPAYYMYEPSGVRFIFLFLHDISAISVELSLTHSRVSLGHVGARCRCR